MQELLLDAAPVVRRIDALYESDKAAARALGIHRETIIRWRQGQRLRERNADRVATLLGCHPTELWSDWYELIDDHEQAIIEAHRLANSTKNAARNRRRAQTREASCPTSPSTSTVSQTPSPLPS